MPFVMAFSSQAFRRADLGMPIPPTVGDLAAEVERQDGEPFVLVEGSTGRAVYVHPAQFAHLRDRAGLEDDLSIVGTGLLGALGAGQLTVDMNSSAATVARLLEAIDGSLAVVASHGDPVGIFVPSALLDALPRASMLADLPNGRQVIALVRDGNLVGALRLAEASFSDFHSEGINAVGPRPLECAWGGGHFVGRCPCRYHTDATCARL